MTRFKVLLVASLALTLLATACGGDDSSDDTSTTVPPSSTPGSSTTRAEPADAEDLVGTEWIVDGFIVGGVDFALVPDASPTVAFSADRPEVSGTTGCNSYFAGVDYVGSGELGIGGVGQTEMACFPDEVMVQERQFTAALSTVRFYDIDGDRLTLVNETGDVMISAVNRDSVEVPIGLGDVVWIAVTRIEGDAASTLVLGAEPTLTFDTTRGNIGGNTGCNSFGATFSVDDGRITIADIIGTERACDGAVMEQERFVYDVLADAATYEIGRNGLTIMTADGRGLGLTPGE